jgi:hypothetical protein
MRNRAEYPPIKNKAINAIPPKNIIMPSYFIVDTVFSAHVEVARALGASDDALKALGNTFKFKGGALGIAQIALASLNSLLFSLFKLFVKSVFVVNIETMK